MLIDGGDSAGLLVSATGTIGDVPVGSAACKAGLGPREKIIAVNGRGFSEAVLNGALRTARGTAQPIDLIVENTDHPAPNSIIATD